jgi:hypothetical protein
MSIIAFVSIVIAALGKQLYHNGESLYKADRNRVA